jgi:predicted metalloprotease with PDZ domain
MTSNRLGGNAVSGVGGRALMRGGRARIVVGAWLGLLPAALAGATDAPGLMLAVDATDVARKLLHANETIPVRPGALTLLSPQWVPGNHRPTGPVVDLTGLRFEAEGKVIAWRRDSEDMYALHLEIPAGITSLEASFDLLLPRAPGDSPVGASSSARLMVLNWHQIVFYPAAGRPDELQVRARLRLPEGWTAVSALEVEVRDGERLRFAPVTLSKLVDSPVLAGAHLARVELTPAGAPRQFLNLAGEDEATLAITDAQKAAYRRLAAEAGALFGAHHFDHYDFLYTLSDQVASLGLEHHQSSDVRAASRTLLDEELRRASATLLPHELVHSWNGKYRRPAELATGDFSTPMRGDLLWVYEGLTEYLGDVLTARAGLWTPEETRDYLALVAAALDRRPGRSWRPLQDTADAAQLLKYGRDEGDAWRRGLDYYDEGSLIWLEADVTIRERTGGKRSLDDFCRAFFGPPSSGPMVRPYDEADIVRALAEVAPFDWKKFFRDRVATIRPRPPLEGLDRAGWRLVYRGAPTPLFKTMTGVDGLTDLRYSLGFAVRADGTLKDVIPDSPAARGGLGAGMRLVAVDGRRYTPDVLRDALRLGKARNAPLELLADSGDFFTTYKIGYDDGERYPALERDDTHPDLLAAILAPRTPVQ